MRYLNIFLAAFFIITSSPLPSPAAPFNSGERLEYSLSWEGIPAGKTVMEFTEHTKTGDREAFHIVATTSSSEAISYFYSLNNRIDTYIDPENFSTLKYKALTSENERQKHESAIFDTLKKEIIYEKKDKTRIIRSTTPAYDSISSIYYIRSLKLKPGETVKLHTFDGGRLFSSEVTYLKKEKIRLKGVIYETLKLQSITKDAASLEKKGELLIWLADNKTRTPLVMKTKIRFGYITSELIKQEK